MNNITNAIYLITIILFQALSLTAQQPPGSTELLPDMIINKDTIRNNYINALPGGGREIRFDNATANIGDGDLVVELRDVVDGQRQVNQIVSLTLQDGSPGTYERPAGFFEYHADHGHIHFTEWTRSRLREVIWTKGVGNPDGIAPGAIVAEGEKTSFCLTDLNRYNPDAPASRNGCSDTRQGITAGWEDIYSASLSGQSIDITGVPDGTYIFESVVDPNNYVLEKDETNNTAYILVTIAGDEITSVPVGTVHFDAYEPNNSIAEVKSRSYNYGNSPHLPVANGTSQAPSDRLVIENLVLTDTDTEDFFRFYVSGSGTVNDFVEVSQTGAEGSPILLELYKEIDDDNILISSVSDIETLVIDFSGITAGWYHVRIHNPTGDGAIYKLTVKPPVTSSLPVVSVTNPATDVSIPHGDIFNIQWETSDTEGHPLWANICLNTSPVFDGNEQWVLSPRNINGVPSDFNLNSALFPDGTYYICVEINNGGQRVRSWSAGTLTIFPNEVNGHIVDVNGDPIPGSTIHYNGSSFPLGPGESLWNLYLQAGTYQIYASAPGYPDSDVREISIPDASGTQHLHFIMGRPELSLDSGLTAAVVEQNSTQTQTLRITNTGSQDLDYRLSSRGQSDSGEVNPPDNYSKSDSDEAEGPAYIWNDISSSGDLLSTASTGDDTSESVDLDWNFNFYGTEYSSIQVSSNGHIGLGTSSATSYSNAALPTTIGYALIAPFWDDLDPSNGGEIYYKKETDRIIVQYNNVATYSGTGSYTFQAVLFRNGDIVYYYNSMTGDVTGATVGAQNSTGSVAVMSAFDSAYIHDGMAVRYQHEGEWIPVEESQGYYSLQDSEQPGGPVFNWNDISSSGDLLSTASTGDDTSESVDLDWNFNFYGTEYSSIQVSSNGHIGLGTSSATSYSNAALPTTIGYALIAPFWDDLDPSNGGEIYYKKETDRIIVQYNNVATYSGTGSYTFQAVLFRNGDIVYYYNSMTGDVTGATAGVQNSTATEATQAAYNTSYIHDGMAVRFSHEVKWISFPQPYGTVAPGQTVDIPVNFSDSEFEYGEVYEAEVILSHNSTIGENPLVLPVTARLNDEFDVNVSQTGQGNVSHSPSPARYGQPLSLTFTADEGYKIKSISIDGQLITTGLTDRFDITIATVTGDIEVSVEYDFILPNLTSGVISEVNENWQTVNLGHEYLHPVIVTTPVYSSSDVPMVTRIRNVTADSFDIRIQRVDGLPGSPGSFSVTYTAVDAGIYNVADHGIKLEAFTFNSTVTDNNQSWTAEPVTVVTDFSNPAVLGQVMSFNDSRWSAFWSRGAAVDAPPSHDNYNIGKNVAEDPDRNRNDETLGCIIAESGSYVLDGKSYTFNLGADSITGPDNISGSYSASGHLAVATLAAMDGANGGWAFLLDNPEPQNGSLKLAVDEDQIGDGERKHTSEQVAYMTVQTVSTSNMKLHSGLVENVTDQWVTVDLPQQYDSMVVVATPVYSATSTPAVPRIRNAAGSSFQIRIQSADGLDSQLNSISLTYIVVEEGIYTEENSGIKLEALKYNSSLTDNTSSWIGEERFYSQSYSQPVVFGQVMSFNDSRWSAFWSRGSSRAAVPGAQFYSGKHTAQDSDRVRTDETIGYIVVESGTYNIDGKTCTAGVGADTVRGMDDSSVSYALEATRVILSLAGMDGSDGGWAVLSNSHESVNGQVQIAVDEDTIQDSERNHTTEQVSYFSVKE